MSHEARNPRVTAEILTDFCPPHTQSRPEFSIEVRYKVSSHNRSGQSRIFPPAHKQAVQGHISASLL